MGQSKRVKSGGHWKPRFANCYTGCDPNDKHDSTFKLRGGKMYWSWYIDSRSFWIGGPEYTEDNRRDLE